MPALRSTARRAAAVLTACAILALTATAALAHPESEGSHPGGCIVTAEPGTISVNGEFTVEGNFGNASIWVLPGADATIEEDQAPDATTPEGDSFSVTFTATGDPGELTVFAAIEGSECGDTDHVTVSGTLPDTAMESPTDAAMAALVLLGGAIALASRRRQLR
jgi:LPXTG-motif cell wall-anchored protein